MIICPKCHKQGMHWFVRRTFHTDAVALDVISCRNCGNWLTSRPVVGQAVDREEAVMTSRPQVLPEIAEAQDRARQEKAIADRQRRSEIASRVNARVKAQNSAPCTMGCGRTINAKKNALGLCKSCAAPLYNWIHKTSHTLPPPMTRVNGVWIKRGDYLPGIPGEQPAPPPSSDVAKPEATPKPRARRRRQPLQEKPAPKPPAFEPELDDLRRLARLGHAASRELLAMMEG